MGNGCFHGTSVPSGHPNGLMNHSTSNHPSGGGHHRKDSMISAGPLAIAASTHAHTSGLTIGTSPYYAYIVKELVLAPASQHETYANRIRSILEVVEGAQRNHPGSFDLQLFARILLMPDSHGWSVIHHAAAKNFKDDFFAPLLSWFDPNGDIGSPLRMELIERGTTKAVGTLPPGCTPLHIAIAKGALEAMRFLLHNGAWPGARACTGESCIAFILRAPESVQHDILDDFQLALNDPAIIADMLRPVELAPVFALSARFDYFGLAWALLRHGADPSVIVLTKPAQPYAPSSAPMTAHAITPSNPPNPSQPFVRRSLFSVLLMRTLEGKEAREKQIIELVHCMLEHGARVPPNECDSGLLHELLSYQQSRGKVVHHYLALLVAAGCEPKLESWRGHIGMNHNLASSTTTSVHVSVSGLTSSVSPAERLAAMLAALRQAISDGHLAEAQCHRGRLAVALRAILPGTLSSLILSYFGPPPNILLASLGLPAASPDIFQLIRTKFIRYR